MEGAAYRGRVLLEISTTLGTMKGMEHVEPLTADEMVQVVVSRIRARERLRAFHSDRLFLSRSAALETSQVRRSRRLLRRDDGERKGGHRRIRSQHRQLRQSTRQRVDAPAVVDRTVDARLQRESLLLRFVEQGEAVLQPYVPVGRHDLSVGVSVDYFQHVRSFGKKMIFFEVGTFDVLGFFFV